MKQVFFLIFAMLVSISTMARAKSQTMICEFEDQHVDFVVKAGLKTENFFHKEGTLIVDGISQLYPLSQKRSHGNQKYHFVLNERVPKKSVKVVVFKTPSEDKVATATLLGVRPHPQDVPGYCVLL